MKGYGQFCPVAKAAEILTERWTPLVLRELLCGSYRFNDLRKGVPLMSPSLLSRRLKELAAAGIVERRPIASGRGWEYHVTEAGRELQPMLEMLGVWGQRWARSRLGPEDLDASLLMWDMHRTIKAERFPPGRTVIQLEFTDGPKGKRLWWLVADRGEVDLCLSDPGHEVDLYMLTDIRTMTGVWMGDISVDAALRADTIELHGESRLRRSLKSWLGLSPFAPVEPAAPEKARV